MPSNRRNEVGLLARVNFPLYTLQMITSRHVLVAGGGGSSRTGVANGFEIYEISHDGSKFCAEEVVRHETGPCVVMNAASWSDHKRTYLLAGHENHCQLYLILNKVETISRDELESDKMENGSVRQRKKPKFDKNSNLKQLKFIIKPQDSIQTDFSPNDPFQRVVRINRTGKLVATGGCDGQIRLWDFPQMQRRHQLSQHSKEIDDIDFCPHDKCLVTVAKDGQAIVWNIKSGKMVRKLVCEDLPKYQFKRCRFAIVENKPETSTLFMLANMAVSQGSSKQQKSGYLQKWNVDDGSLQKAVPSDESLSALAVRDDGRFVAVGTMLTGSVAIYIAFSLQRILMVPSAHSMFVTGLEFLPVTQNNHTVTSATEAAVLSISVDNRVCIHSLPHRSSIPAWVAIVIIISTLFMAFMLCAYLGI